MFITYLVFIAATTFTIGTQMLGDGGLAVSPNPTALLGLVLVGILDGLLNHWRYNNNSQRGFESFAHSVLAACVGLIAGTCVNLLPMRPLVQALGDAFLIGTLLGSTIFATGHALVIKKSA